MAAINREMLCGRQPSRQQHNFPRVSESSILSDTNGFPEVFEHLGL